MASPPHVIIEVGAATEKAVHSPVIRIGPRELLGTEIELLETLARRVREGAGDLEAGEILANLLDPVDLAEDRPERLWRVVEAETLPKGWVDIPWEGLVDRDTGLSYAIQAGRAIFRQVVLPDLPSTGFPKAGQLKVLLLGGHGTWSDAWLDGLKEAVARELVSVQLLDEGPPFRLSGLRKTLEAWQPDLVVGLHSSSPAAADLMLAQAPWLDALIGLLRPPRLVVLVGDPADRERVRDLRESFLRLARLNVEGVVGTAFGQRISTAIFCQTLIEGLAQCRALSEAIPRATYEMLSSDKDSRPPLPVVYAVGTDLQLVAPVARGGQRAVAVPATQALTPFVGLRSYNFGDAEAYLGREAEIRDLCLRLWQHQKVLLYGRSGDGKSSFLRAGLAARLIAEGHEVLLIDRYDVATGVWGLEFLESDEDLVDAILTKFAGLIPEPNKRRVLLLDQAEDLRRLSSASRRRLLHGVFSEDAAGRSVVVIATRLESLRWLRHEISESTEGWAEPYQYLMAPLTIADGREILNRLGRTFNFGMEEDLKRKLFNDLAGLPLDQEPSEGSVGVPLLLPQFSLVLEGLYARRRRGLEQDLLLSAEYPPEPGVRTLIAYQLREAIAQLPLSTDQAVGVLVRMFDHGTGRPLPVSIVGLTKKSGEEQAQVAALLEALFNARLCVRLDDEHYELIHELLATTIRTEFVNEDLVQKDQLIADLEVAAQEFRETGEPIVPALINQVLRVAEWTELPVAVRACLLGSWRLTGQGVGSDAAWLTDERERTAILNFFLESPNPRVKALALGVLEGQPPHVRGLAPIPLPPPPKGQEASARFLGEKLLPLVAARALGQRLANNEDDSTRARLQQKAHLLLSDPGAFNVAAIRELLPDSWSLCWGLGLGRWPGLWLGHTTIGVLTFVLSAAISRLLWSSPTQTLTEVCFMWLLIGSVLGGAAVAIMDREVAAILNPAAESITSRFKGVLEVAGRSLLFGMGSANLGWAFAVIFLRWLDEDLITLQSLGQLVDFCLLLPFSAFDLVSILSRSFLGFLGGLPLVGDVIGWAITQTSGGPWWLKIVVILVAGFVGLIMLAFALPTLFLEFTVVVCLPLLPLVTAVQATILAVDSCWTRSSEKKRWLRFVASAATAGGLLTLLQPWVFKLASVSMLLLYQYSWNIEWLIDQPRLSTWAALLASAGDYSVKSLWVLLFPGLVVALFRILGSWRFRVDKDDSAQCDHWPLIAEGSFAALVRVLEDLRSKAALRDRSAFELCLQLALRDPSPLFTELDEVQREGLADRAAQILQLFDNGYFQSPLLLSRVRRALLPGEGGAAIRIRHLITKISIAQAMIRVQQEPLAVEAEKDAEPTGERPALKRLGHLLGQVTLALAVIVFMGAFLHTALGAARALIDLCYPLDVQIIDEWWNFDFTLMCIKTILKLAIFIALVVVLANPRMAIKKIANTLIGP